MTQAQQKKQERLHLERFLAALGDPRRFQVEDSETPDFYLRSVADAGEVLGVEVSDLFRPATPDGQSLQAQEDLRGRVLRRAESSFRETTPTPVQVAVHFNDNYRFRKHDVNRLSGALVAIVQRNLPPVEGAHREEQYVWVNRSYFPKEFSHIIVDRLPGARSFWRAPGATYVSTVGLDHIQGIVNAKSKLSARYRKACAEVWLLLVADGFSLATMLEFDLAVYREVGRGGFDRIFLLQDQRRIHELGTTLVEDAGHGVGAAVP